MGSVGSVDEGLGTGTLLAVPSALSSEPHNVQSLLSQSCLLSTSTEPRQSGCGLDFVRWLFKRAPGFLAGSPLPSGGQSPR